MPLPNFLLIGAYKSGTSSVYGYLSQHPDIYMPRIKEPSFFALEGETERAGPNKIVHLNDYLRLFEGHRGEKAIGEASPMYLHSAKAVERIRHYIPDSRFIAILRNPVEAFHSNHYMHVREGRRREDFQASIDRYLEKLRAGEASGPLYHAHLSRYYRTFGPERIRVYLFEDLRNDARALMRDIYAFLGVDPDFEPDLERQRNVGGIPRLRWLHALTRPGRRRTTGGLVPSRLARRLYAMNLKPVPPMTREQRLQLLEVFRDDIERLQSLIGRDLGHWLDPDGRNEAVEPPRRDSAGQKNGAHPAPR